jgi:hypothetical protein
LCCSSKAASVRGLFHLLPYLSPGHHVEGGSLAVILVVCSATWDAEAKSLAAASSHKDVALPLKNI